MGGGDSGMIQFEEFNEDTYNTMYITRDKVENVPAYRAKYNAFIQEYMSYILEIPLFKETKKPVPKGAKGFNPETLVNSEREMVKEFLTKQYPGEYDHLFPDDE